MQKSILIYPGTLPQSAFQQNTSLDVTLTGIPAIKMLGSGTAVLRVDSPIPHDWNGTPIKLITVYTSNDITGEILMKIVGGTYTYDATNPVPYNMPYQTTPAPAGLYGIKSLHTELVVSPNANFINIMVRRDADHPDDTCPGVMQIIGFILEYESNS